MGGTEPTLQSGDRAKIMTKFPKDFEKALRVLAIAVIVDQKIRDPEIAAFTLHASALAELMLGHPLPAKRAKDWFSDVEPEILDDIKGRGRNTVILKALIGITDEMTRENLYDAMIAISVSDKEYHREESDLIRSAATIWGFMRPSFAVAQPPEDA